MQLNDRATGNDNINALPQISLTDKGKWIGEFKLTKYDFTSADGVINRTAQKAFEKDSKAGMSDAYLKNKYGRFLKSSKVIGRNLLTNYGINNIIWPAVAGGSYTAMNNANARLGVGDSTTAAAASQTDLQAATNKTYQAMDATFPTQGTSQLITFRATFGSGSANYHWQEYISDNGTAGHAMNRLVSDQGTKTSGQSWQLTLTVTLS
jgi:hypothetical protein